MLPAAHRGEHQALHADPSIQALVLALWCCFVNAVRAEAVVRRQPVAQPLAKVVLLRLSLTIGAPGARRDPFTRLAVSPSAPRGMQAWAVLLASMTLGANPPHAIAGARN